MRNDSRRRGPWVLLLRDLVLVGVVLVVFALFHHVLPRPANAMRNITSIPPAATPVPVPTATPDAGAAASAPASASPSATPAPSRAPGDFTDAFPTEDTGAGALHSYQSDTLRVAIEQVQENGVTYYVADVWVRDISGLRTAFANGQYGGGIHDDPLNIAVDSNAIFAITGDYCGARGKGIVIRNGDLYRDSINSDVCVLYADGVMETYAQADFDLQAAIDRGAWQAWGFGPQLLDNGKAIDQFDSAVQRKNPRSSIGYYEPGHYCFITVDGRQPGYSDGMSLAELSAVYEALGCKAAFNLDGGATAQMIFQGELVNKPYNGGRESSDIICFSGGAA